jgi:hypothetical protein
MKSLASDIRCVICTLKAVADAMDTAYSDSDLSDYTEPAEQTEAAVPEMPKPITLDEVRAVLSEKSANGKRAEVKAILTKFGVSKLSDISPDKFADVLKEAEAI